MTIGDVKQLIECSRVMSHEALLAAFLEISGQLIETMTALEGYHSSSGEFALQYQQMKDKADGYEEDNKRLNSLVNLLPVLHSICLISSAMIMAASLWMTPIRHTLRSKMHPMEK